MRYHTIARQVRRDVHLTACLAVALATLGCGSLPMVASKVEPAPFQDHDLAFLEAGSTDLATLTEELGPATIVRSDGRLEVYAAAVNQKRVVMVGSGSPFKHHYLIVELDSHDVVQRFEVVRPKRTPLFGTAGLPCTSWGVCILRDPWQYHMGLFSLGHEVLPAGNDIAVVLDTAEADVLAKEYLPSDDECAIYLYNALKSGVWSLIRVATDEKPRRYLPEGTYCWFTAPPGRHAIRASFGPDCEVKQTRTFELDCEPARSYFLSLAGKTCSKTSITLEPEATARQALKERRLIFW